MKFVSILLGVAFCAFAAVAEDAPQPVVSEALVTMDDCKRLLKHTPRDDVAYRAGVDVRGNPVAAADLASDQAPITLPENIVIDFGINLAGRYGVPGDGFITSTSDLFSVRYDLALGALTVNGKALNKADSAAVVKACTMMLDNPTPASPGK